MSPNEGREHTHKIRLTHRPTSQIHRKYIETTSMVITYDYTIMVMHVEFETETTDAVC